MRFVQHRRRCGKNMGSQSQWEDAYCIAERMFNADCPMKRTDLNMLEQSICSKYKSIFQYDAFTDEYSFINQELKLDEPVKPFCRDVAEVDLDELKKNTVKVNLQTPSYINIVPLCVVPPAAMLVFNHTQPVADGLTEALQNAKSALTVNPTESEVKPGGEFLFKHRDEKCYRCIVIAQVGDDKGPDANRRYEVAFLDHRQIVQVNLKTLFISVDLGLDKFPCALHIARPFKIASFRSGFVKEYNELVRTFSADKDKRKAGLMALIYKTDSEGMKLVIDFPSLYGNECTNSEEIRFVQGHYAAVTTDPFPPLTYEQLINQVILPFEYPETEQKNGEKKNDEEKKGESSGVDNICVVEDDGDDVELDLSDTEPTTLPQSIRLKEVAESECLFGRASIDNFIQKHMTAGKEPLTKNTAVESPNTVHPPSQKKEIQPPQQLHHNNNIEGSTIDTQFNESLSSLRSGTIDQTCSSTPTPQPTFNELIREDSTPKKSDHIADSGSTDGWDTPKKSPQKSNNFTEFESQKPLIKASAVMQFGEFSPPVQSLQRPQSPTPQTVIEKNSVGIPSETAAIPLMSIKTHTPEKYKFGFSSKPSDNKNKRINEDQLSAFPVPNIGGGDVNIDITSPQSEQILNKDRTFSSPVFIDSKAEPAQTDDLMKSTQQSRLNENKSLIGHTSTQSDLEDAICDWDDDEERHRTTVNFPENLNTYQDADISKASSNQRMINKAQDNFDDFEDLLDTPDIQNSQDAAKIFENVDSDVIVAENKASGSINNFGGNPVCFEESRQSGSTELAVDADSVTAALVDKFADVSQVTKSLASSFIKDINDVVIQKNRSAYWMEIAVMEAVSHKLSDGPDRRYWKSKIAEARKLDETFD